LPETFALREFTVPRRQFVRRFPRWPFSTAAQLALSARTEKIKIQDGGFVRKFIFCLCLAVFLFSGTLLHATIFGKIQGIVHDPQHRPVAGASVKLQAITSDWSQTAQTDDNGEFSFTSVPVGDYKITVTQPKFQSAEQTVTVASSSSPVLHFQLAIAALNQTTVVVG
jgi:hypothetical protein